VRNFKCAIDFEIAGRASAARRRALAYTTMGAECATRSKRGTFPTVRVYVFGRGTKKQVRQLARQPRGIFFSTLNPGMDRTGIAEGHTTRCAAGASEQRGPVWSPGDLHYYDAIRALRGRAEERTAAAHGGTIA